MHTQSDIFIYNSITMNGFLCFGNCHSLYHVMSKSSVSCILQYRLCSQGLVSFRSRRIGVWTAQLNQTHNNFITSRYFVCVFGCVLSPVLAYADTSSKLD